MLKRDLNIYLIQCPFSSTKRRNECPERLSELLQVTQLVSEGSRPRTGSGFHSLAFKELHHLVTKPKWVPSRRVKSDSPPEVVFSPSKVYLQQTGDHEESLPESWRPLNKGKQGHLFGMGMNIQKGEVGILLRRLSWKTCFHLQCSLR